MQPHGFHFDHPCGLRVSRDLPESQVLSVEGVQTHDMRTGYVWYRLPVVTSEGESISISLGYHLGHLDFLWIRVTDGNLEPNWSEWSEDKEHAVAQRTAVWLAARGYPLGSYNWGEIWSHYDPKSGMGSGGVRYKQKSLTHV